MRKVFFSIALVVILLFPPIILASVKFDPLSPVLVISDVEAYPLGCFQMTFKVTLTSILELETISAIFLTSGCPTPLAYFDLSLGELHIPVVEVEAFGACYEAIFLVIPGRTPLKFQLKSVILLGWPPPC
jgi:hypothetical protein